MKFRALKIPGAFLVELEKREDHRGFFARSWCQEEFRNAGLRDALVQTSISFNRYRGTLRGLHYQAAPFEEAKLVRCIRGSVFDVIVDLRFDSAAFQKWESVRLDAQCLSALYIPEGVAHGFQTLEDSTELLYQCSQVFHHDSARTLRWDDPKLGIAWPISDPILSEKDRKPNV